MAQHSPFASPPEPTLQDSATTRGGHAPPTQASSSLPNAELTADRYARLESGREGLSDEEAAGRLVQHGANQFGSNRVTAWSVLARQLRNPLLALLLVAALLSAFVDQYSDAVVIALIASASVGLGFVDEYRTERSVASLRQRISHTATVLRSGRVLRVPVAELVPGDVVMLGVGTVVPADVVLVEGHEIELDESVITGESLPVIKGATMLGPPTSTSTVADRSPEQAWMGTVVRRGEARAVVVATGAATMLGRIAQQLDVAPEASGFMIGLRRFSRFLASVGLALAGAVFVINLLLHRGVLEAATFSLAIAIGITPQLLPAIVTMSLATGSKRLADQNVLVKRLVSIEDLGNVDVLYTDKTGTLTEGKIGFDRCVATSETGSDDLLLLEIGRAHV